MLVARNGRLIKGRSLPLRHGTTTGRLHSISSAKNVNLISAKTLSCCHKVLFHSHSLIPKNNQRLLFGGPTHGYRPLSSFFTRSQSNITGAKNKTISTSETIATETATQTQSPSSSGGKIIEVDSVGASSSTSSSNLWKYGIGGGMVLGLVGGYGYIHNELGGPQGIYRSLSFYSKAIPRYLEYRYLQIMSRPDDEWEELDERASRQGLDKIMELRGFYIKAGQMAASNIGNGFPRIWQDTLSVLQDQCPHKEFPEVKEIIEDSFQKPINEIFEWVEEKPLGAASIGQVHKAKRKDTGEIVVVKVMYPEAETVFRGDVRTLKMFCMVAQPVHVPSLEQTEKHFMSEFDYEEESKQQERIRLNLVKAGLAGGGPNAICEIPRIHTDLCTKRAVVMEYFEGDKLADGLTKDMIRHATRQGMSAEEFLQREEELDKEARARKQLRYGPNVKEFETYIALRDAQRRTSNLYSRIYNLSLAWWMPGATHKPIDDKSTLPINHAKIVDDLLHIHGHQILVDGCFNGDPHPGNLLLLGADKGNPKLGLIDYGQVKVLSKEDRLLFCKLVIAMDEDNRSEIVRLMKEAGYKAKNMNEDNIYRYAKVYYDEDSYDLTWGLHVQVFAEQLQAIDPIISVPDEYVMIGRACLMLRGLAHALHQSRSCAKAWRPIAERVLKEEGIQYSPLQNEKKQRPVGKIIVSEKKREASMAS